MVFGRKKQEPVQEMDGQGAEGPRLTPVDVQQKVFRLAFRGYNEQDVDRFLDKVTEDLAALHEENKRLREELELQGPGEGAADARRHAEEIIRRAREEAARISAGGASVADAAASAPYLVREREFLQQLARLVQGHAETLKAEARRARPQAAQAEEEPSGSDDNGEEEEEEGERQPEAAEQAVPESPAPKLDETAPMPPPGEPDPGELAEWTNPFVSEEGVETSPDAEEGEDQEPSLRELFWGEE